MNTNNTNNNGDTAMTITYTTEERISNAIEWIDSLAAQSFKKGTGTLGEYHSGMCCLGVVNHLFSLGVNHHENYLFAMESGIDVVGLKPNTQETLAEMNDGQDGEYSGPFVEVHSHPEIAKALVSNPYKYFISEVAEGVAEHYWITT